jgi:hypothetical protein
MREGDTNGFRRSMDEGMQYVLTIHLAIVIIDRTFQASRHYAAYPLDQSVDYLNSIH